MARVTSEVLNEAIKEVLYNQTYTDNALEASGVMRDHPVSAKEKFYFYIDYMIRHKGASRLAVEPLKTLNTFQLFLADVVVVIVLLIVSVLLLLHCCLLQTFRIVSKAFSYSKKQKMS